MEFDGKQEALEREAQRETSKPTPVARKSRGARKPAKAAAQAEALAKGVEFDFDGKHYTVEPADQWDLEVFEYAQEGDIINAVRTLIGDEQYREFKTDEDGNKVKRVLQDLSDFWDAAQRAQGVEPGESNS